MHFFAYGELILFTLSDSRQESLFFFFFLRKFNISNNL